jgi:crotonobetainyl-CoA:carnitine CoA-transferase CaiB-like acyl-CoA transferase
VDVAMADASLAHNIFALHALEQWGRVLPRGADLLTGGVPCYGVYPTQDGRWLAALNYDGKLEAPVLDMAIPRRLRPRFGSVSYAQLKSGLIQVEGRRVTAAPAHSPRLAEAIGAELIAWLQDGRFPLGLPVRPLSGRCGLIPLDS